MKGFIISLDAAVAISFVLLVMIMIASQSYNPRAPSGIYLKQLSMDTMTVLEKTNRIELALAGNNSAVREALEATPILACMEIEILDNKGNLLKTITKSDCTETAGLDMQIITRPLLYQNNVYILRSESWFKKEAQ